MIAHGVSAMTPNRPPNRLIHETSPYLLQHAYNPVDWYPWGPEAIEKARRENKAILLSIGYSACHWCHVMERESFEDEEIAAIMNRHFVSIKVDREERPDLDQIYQSAVQLFIRRGGGWPLTIFLTPDQIPFYGGTYFPPNDRHGMPGFPAILTEVASAYAERPGDVAKTVQDVQRALQHISEGHAVSEKQTISPEILALAVQGLSPLFDSTYGGFGAAPKFPSTASLALFLRYANQTGDATVLNQVTYTLGKMAWGGIYDQLGGGFHRYSTDRQWLVPHFEKMLYDNAQLARIYFSTYQATGQTFYRNIGEEILEYVLREMTDPAGGFYATQDADSEGEEGRFFVWTPDEIKSVLGARDGEVLCRHFNVTANGNFEGKTILNIQRPLESTARAIGVSLEDAEATLKEGKKKLFVEREARPKPFRDEKILTNLNGLMIGAFVEGYQVTRNQTYLAAAQKAAQFVLDHLYKEGRLLRTFKDGTAKLNGYLDDYAYFIDALLDLYEATSTVSYLDNARALMARLLDQFWDAPHGGFFFTSRDHEKLVTRHKTYMDQSVPSGNAVAALCLLRLFYLTGEERYFDRGEETLKTFSAGMEENPFATGNLIAVADFYLRKPKEIVILGKRDVLETEELLTKLYKRYLPNKVVRVIDPDGPAPDFAEGKRSIDGKPTVYICQNFTCSAPLTDWEKIEKALVG